MYMFKLTALLVLACLLTVRAADASRNGHATVEHQVERLVVQDSRSASQAPAHALSNAAERALSESSSSHSGDGACTTCVTIEDPLSRSSKQAKQVIATSIFAPASSTGYIGRSGTRFDEKRMEGLADQHIGSAVRHRRDTTVTFTMASPFTNGSFATQLCEAVGTDTRTLIIPSFGTNYFLIPLCLESAGSDLTSITAAGVVIDDFSNLPTKLTTLVVTSSYIQSAIPGVASTYFDADGTLLWTKIWTRFSYIATLQLSTAHLRGNVPSALPISLKNLQLQGNLLSGSIPADMFSNYFSHSNTFSDMLVTLSDNPLSGTLSAGLFSQLGSATWGTLPTILFTAHNCGIYGTLPSSLLQPLASAGLKTLILDLSLNSIEGPMPTVDFFPTNMMSASAPAVFNFDISSNKMNGSITPMFFANLSPISSISFVASDNRFSGSLPTSFLPSGYSPQTSSGLVINLNNNLLTGTIPATFLTATLAQNVSFGGLQLSLAMNALSGSIPENLYYRAIPSTKRGQLITHDRFNGDMTESNLARDSAASEQSTAGVAILSMLAKSSLTLTIHSNNISGTLPRTLFYPYVGMPSTYHPTVTLTAYNNSISGTVPDDIGISVPYSTQMTLSMRSNQLTGSPPSLCQASTLLRLDLAFNLLDGSLPNSYQSCNVNLLEFSSNTKLSGTIPPNLFNSSNGLYFFFASNTSLWGVLPAIPPLSTLVLKLDHTLLQFCSSPSNLTGAFFTPVCDFSFTEACNCPSMYPNALMSCSGPTIGPVAPGIPPSLVVPTTETPAAPSASPSAPSASPSAPSASPCSSATRPTPDFTCVNGTWTAPATNGTVLVIPPGAGTVVITGNVNTTSLEIHGLGSTVEIGGSVILVTTVHVQFSPSQAETLGGGKVLQILMTLSNSSTANLSSIAVSANVASGSCKKVKVEKVVLDDGATLGAYFTLDKSGCKTWWIILVSVICGLVLLAVIVVVALVIFWKPFREKIRPYSKARKGKAEFN